MVLVGKEKKDHVLQIFGFFDSRVCYSVSTMRAWVVSLAVVCLLAQHARAASYVIKVGATNTVSFAPTAQTVAVGDTVIFEFMRAGDRGE